MDTQSDGIWIIDENAVTLYANVAMAEILGTTVPRLIGKHSFDFLFPEDSQSAQRLFDARQRGETASPFRFRLKRQDGSPIWVQVQGTPMHNVDGNFIGIVGTFRVFDPAPVDA
jgi:PAS domain S-box-containing protein